MALRILHQSDAITISYDYLNEWLLADWHGDQTYQTVTTEATRMLGFVRSERCRKVLNDNTRVTGMWSDAAEWGGREWFPAMSAAGCEYFAWVYSPDMYSRLSTDLTLQHTVANIVVLTFDDLTLAAAWLRQM